MKKAAWISSGFFVKQSLLAAHPIQTAGLNASLHKGLGFKTAN
jgi:hypothetical protein